MDAADRFALAGAACTLGMILGFVLGGCRGPLTPAEVQALRVGEKGAEWICIVVADLEAPKAEKLCEDAYDVANSKLNAAADAGVDR